MAAQYFIENGVHRAVAARANGCRLIPAVLYVDGQQPRWMMVALKDLHSPIRSIRRSDPRHKYDLLEAAMATVIGRARMPPISIQPLGAANQPRAIPLDQVQILS